MHSETQAPFRIAYHCMTRFSDQIFCFGGELPGGKVSDLTYRTSAGILRYPIIF